MPYGIKKVAQWTAWAAVGLVVVAISFGRGKAEPETKGLAGPRHPAHPRYHAFNGYWFSGDHSHQSRLLDTESGNVELLELTAGERLDNVSCSPWQDALGRYHLAGRRSVVNVGDPEGPTGALGIVRGIFPGGEVLDRIPFEVIPVAPVCWFPDQSNRILFVASDGWLYVVALSGAPGAGDQVPVERPRRIRWKVGAPGRGPAYIQHVCWPSGEAFGGRVLVALRPRRPAARSYGELQFWWLELSADSTAIVAAGRLFDAAERRPGQPGVRSERRCPTVGVTPDGGSLLAYVMVPEGSTYGELWTAPIAFESGAGGRVPRIERGTARRVATACLAATPAFSADGRWLFAMVGERATGTVRVQRFAVAPARALAAAH
jgi:hypothetical protein